MIDSFAELTLEARDPRRLERFYRGAFGFETLARDDDRVWLGVGKTARLGLWRPGPKEFGDEGGRHVHFAFSAEPGTLDELARRVTEQASVCGPVEHPGGDRSIYVEDPEGNIVEVWDFFRRGSGAREGVDALR
jgi:catechol-2,3-dioxygenase